MHEGIYLDQKKNVINNNGHENQAGSYYKLFHFFISTSVILIWTTVDIELTFFAFNVPNFNIYINFFLNINPASLI